jgi:hypothetical protein
MADALRAMIAAGGDPYGNSQELMLEAISVLRHAGVVRPDIAPPDVSAMLTGTTLAGRPEHREQAERLLDFALDAMSTSVGEPPGQPVAPAP